VDKAKNLPLVSDYGGKQPYCNVVVNDITKIIETDTETELFVKKSPNIRWNRKLVFRGLKDAIVDNNIEVKIDIFDQDIHFVEHTIGTVIIEVKGFKRGVLQSNWYGLGEQGLIKIGIQPLDFGDISLPDIISTNITSTPVSYIRDSERLVPSPNVQVTKPTGLIQYEPKDLKRKKCISSGTYGVIYKSKVKNLKETVVIKDMNIEQEDSVSSWKNEIEIMAQNKSRYITNIIGYCFSDKTLSIVMEYVKRKSLFDVLHKKSSTLSLLHRLRMSRHCLRGLVWLHNKNIAHRDVKSLNILVTKDYSCKLTDFGNSKLYLINHNTPNVGSKLWMAPEVKSNVYDPKASDIWSMGIVLFEIFNSSLPDWDVEEEIAVLPEEDYIGKELVTKCVIEAVDQRPLAHEILEALDSWIENILHHIFESNILQEKKIKKMRRENDDDIIELYNYLVTKNPYHVDSLLTQIVGLPEPKFKTQELYGNNFFQEAY